MISDHLFQNCSQRLSIWPAASGLRTKFRLSFERKKWTKHFNVLLIFQRLLNFFLHSCFHILKTCIPTYVPIGNKLHFQGQALHIDKIFLSKGLISSFNLISQKKIVLNVLSIFNNYFSKNILAGAPNRNKNSQ